VADDPTSGYEKPESFCFEMNCRASFSEGAVRLNMLALSPLRVLALHFKTEREPITIGFYHVTQPLILSHTCQTKSPRQLAARKENSRVRRVCPTTNAVPVGQSECEK
jgi:hypothetical protein